MKIRLPEIRGVIRRRLLVNFRVDPDVIAPQLPAPFRPKLHEGQAVAGICLIRLEHIRPSWAPQFLGLSSENAAHRIAVVWEEEGEQREGVYIPRRDTASRLNRLAGGRLFPGEQSAAAIRVWDNDGRVALDMKSRDGRVAVSVTGQAAAQLPADSIFRTVDEASDFFEPGSVGYSATSSGKHLDGIVLRTENWSVAPLEVEHVYSSYFADEKLFPPKTAKFDCALVMRNIDHRWRSAERLYL